MDPRPGRWLLRSLGAGLLATALLSADARAETVRLRDGKALEVERVVFDGARVEVTMRRDGGTARVVLKLAQLEPSDVLPLWDRTHSPYDARDVLASADVALRLGAHAEAANRYEVAFRLDAALKPRRDAGLARIRAIEARAAVEDVESRVRAAHDLHGAVALARALLEGPGAADLPAAQRRRIEALAALAERVALRAAAREAEAHAPAKSSAATPVAEPVPPAPQPAPAPAAGPVSTAEAVVAAIRDAVGALALRADTAREAAADVTISARRAIRHLEDAAGAWLLARRLVREAPDAAIPHLGEVADDLRLALAQTYLDLADLYRQERLFPQARARVRAVLILDPGNEHAWEQRRLIEDDLRAPPTTEGGWRPAVETYVWSPSPFVGWHGLHGCGPCPTPYAVPYRGHGGAWFGFRGGRRVHRTIGRRR